MQSGNPGRFRLGAPRANLSIEAQEIFVTKLDMDTPEDYEDRLTSALVRTVAEVSTVTLKDGSQRIIFHSPEICGVLLEMMAWQAAAAEGCEHEEGRLKVVAGFAAQFAHKLEFQRAAYEKGAYGDIQVIHQTKGTKQ
jgi:hypothetical protein